MFLDLQEAGSVLTPLPQAAFPPNPQVPRTPDVGSVCCLAMRWNHLVLNQQTQSLEYEVGTGHPLQFPRWLGWRTVTGSKADKHFPWSPPLGTEQEGGASRAWKLGLRSLQARFLILKTMQIRGLCLL